MPQERSIEVLIGEEAMDVSSIEELPISISYKLEDKEDFQSKKSSEALSIIFPATRQNDKIGNTFHNPSVKDLTAGETFRSIRSAIIRSGGTELLTGKAFLKNAKHTDVPTEYEYDFYGNNADWAIDLKESTLYDFLKQITFNFTKANIINSWTFDGTSEALPYVFAPVRYGDKMGAAADPSGKTQDDYNMYPEYMKPSLSKYWIIYWAFKSLGYKIHSSFFDLEYFRRQVMPWVWGGFLDSDGTRMDILKFLAKSTQEVSIIDEDFEGLLDAMVSNDSTNGGFDNSNTYSYVSGNEMRWEYLDTPTTNFGPLDATLHINVFVDATVVASSSITIEVQWLKNGVQVGASTMLLDISAPLIGRRDAGGNYEDYKTFNVNPGDTISARLWVHQNSTSIGRASLKLTVDAFEIAYFRVPLGGVINFENFLGLKKYKFLDLLRGVIDEFNISVGTDNVNKAVYFEPTHPYAIGVDISEPSGGYFNGNFLDWAQKQDISKESKVENFVDSERELIFKYKDDTNDGTLKKIQDRNTNTLAVAKYVFPDRFKSGKKEIINRFFSPTMHYDVEQWRTSSTEPPQMVILVPENISNTSRGEAQNTFNPKSCYYKGLTTSYKWVFDNEAFHPYPFMFAVNYKTGGEADPILSYADESVGPDNSPVIGKGLLRRFFHQRLSIMRNGIYYLTWFRLNNNDVSNFLHREHIIVRGQKWELVEINNYKPLKDESTEVLLRKWTPLTNA